MEPLSGAPSSEEEDKEITTNGNTSDVACTNNV